MYALTSVTDNIFFLIQFQNMTFTTLEMGFSFFFYFLSLLLCSRIISSFRLQKESLKILKL